MRFRVVWALLLCILVAVSGSSQSSKPTSSLRRKCLALGLAGCVYFWASGGLDEVNRLRTLTSGKTVSISTYRLNAWMCTGSVDFGRVHETMTVSESDSMIALAEHALRSSDTSQWVPAVSSLYEAIRWKVNQVEFPILPASQTVRGYRFQQSAVRNSLPEVGLLEWAWWLSEILAIHEDLNKIHDSPSTIRIYLGSVDEPEYGRIIAQVGLNTALEPEAVPESKLGDVLNLVKDLVRDRMRMGAIIIAARYQSLDFDRWGLPNKGMSRTSSSVYSHCDVLGDWEPNNAPKGKPSDDIRP